MENTVVWFDIPVTDIERAKEFYQAVIGAELTDMENGPARFAMFPFAPGIASGALVQSPDSKPSDSGTTVYLNGGKDLSDPLSRVESAGGKIVMPKTSIGENGFMARFQDTEGNVVALHSLQ